MNYNSFVKTTHINKILKFCQKPVRINLYKFNGKEFKRSMYPKTGKAEIIVNMLLEKNHFFGIKNMKRINELKQSEFKIITEDKNEEDEDILPSEFKTKIIDKVNNQKLDLSKDCFWDCETHLNDNGQHVVYNVGYGTYKQVMDNQVKVNYGYDALKLFIEDLKIMAKMCKEGHEWCFNEKYKDKQFKNESERNYYFLMDKHKYIKTFWSHNGGRYNHFLLLQQLPEIEKVINNNGLLYMSIFDGYIEFKDFYRHCNESLSDLCKAYGLEAKYSKTEFPHEFVNTVKDIYYNGPVPDDKYFPSGKKPYFYGPHFDLKYSSIKYQKLDVIALCRVFDKYCRQMSEITKLSPNVYLTAPSLSYKYLIKSITEKNEMHIIKNQKVDKFIRNSIRGGRTFVQKSYFETKSYNKLNNIDSLSEKEKVDIYNGIDDYLTDLDATSLYPSAMCMFKYPVGKPNVLFEDHFEILKNKINSLQYDKLSIIQCDLIFEHPEKYTTPLISEKEKNGVTNFTFIPKNKIIITSVDLEEAIKYNSAKITKIYNAIEWAKCEFIFREPIGKLFELRLKNKQNAIGAVCKNLMNSSWGKLTMQEINESVSIFNTNAEFKCSLLTGNVTGFQILNDDQIMCNIKKESTDKTVGSPSYLGAFVLAYSKRIMNNAIHTFNGFKDWDSTFYYTDTDSLIVDYKVLSKLKETLVTYPGLNEPIQLFGEVMGSLHDDIKIVKNGKIIKSIFIKPKC